MCPCDHLLGGKAFVASYIYLPRLLNFTATTCIMPESKLKIPNTTKPPATPPAIAAMLDWLSEGTKGVCVYTFMIVMKNF